MLKDLTFYKIKCNIFLLRRPPPPKPLKRKNL